MRFPNQSVLDKQFLYVKARAYASSRCPIKLRNPRLSNLKDRLMAHLEITLQIQPQDRAAAADVFHRFKQPFLDQIEGAVSKRLLVRDEDVQVLHGFSSAGHARAYLDSALFKADVVTALKPLLLAAPDVRIYQER